LLLARCNELLRTESNLSRVSCLFNPELQECNLTTDYRLSRTGIGRFLRRIGGHPHR